MVPLKKLGIGYTIGVGLSSFHPGETCGCLYWVYMTGTEIILFLQKYGCCLMIGILFILERCGVIPEWFTCLGPFYMQKDSLVPSIRFFFLFEKSYTSNHIISLIGIRLEIFVPRLVILIFSSYLFILLELNHYFIFFP